MAPQNDSILRWQTDHRSFRIYHLDEVVYVIQRVIQECDY